jgi:hypothetical protein
MKWVYYRTGAVDNIFRVETSSLIAFPSQYQAYLFLLLLTSVRLYRDVGDQALGSLTFVVSVTRRLDEQNSWVLGEWPLAWYQVLRQL